MTDNRNAWSHSVRPDGAGARRGLTRREFLKAGAAAASAALGAGLGARTAHAAGETIRVGLIGCGSTGVAAVRDCLRAPVLLGERAGRGVEVVALADPFEDRLEALGAELGVGTSRRFAGLDGYRELCALDGLDLVILAAPCAFRPVHLASAIEAGKNVFVVPPIAICPAGCKLVTESSAKAREKKLAIIVGSERRYDPATIETLKRVAEGAIGRIIAGQCYWNQGGLYVRPRRIGEGDVEWQLRNWRYFRWLSGDIIVERHVHNIDVINWAIGSGPERIHGLGGRQYRTAGEYGDVYDHFGVEFFYPNDVHVLSLCRQIDGSDERIGERLVGTKGTTDCRGRIEGENAWVYGGPGGDGRVRAFAAAIDAIRKGEPVNDAAAAVESAFTAVMARESAYTRLSFKRSWFAAKCTLNMLPPAGLALGAVRRVEPAPVPGVYQIPGAA